MDSTPQCIRIRFRRLNQSKKIAETLQQEFDFGEKLANHIVDEHVRGEPAAMPWALSKPYLSAICNARNMWKLLVITPTEALSSLISFLLLTMFSSVVFESGSSRMRCSSMPCSLR